MVLILKNEYAIYSKRAKTSTDDERLYNGTLYLFHDRLHFICNDNLIKKTVHLKDVIKVQSATNIPQFWDFLCLQINVIAKDGTHYFSVTDRNLWVKEILRLKAIVDKNKYNKLSQNDYAGNDYGGYYKYAQEYYSDGKYSKAIEYINHALKYDPYNETFINLKQNIIDRLATSYDYKNEDDYGGFYRYAREYYRNCQYNQALEYINHALEYDPYNTTFQKLKNDILDKLNYRPKEYIKEVEPQEPEPQPEPVKSENITTPVNLSDCTKEDIMTLNGFDETKADRFIKERENGMMWYNIDSFTDYFQIQPHERVIIEERLVFPLKPQLKHGRKVDF